MPPADVLSAWPTPRAAREEAARLDFRQGQSSDKGFQATVLSVGSPLTRKLAFLPAMRGTCG